MPAAENNTETGVKDDKNEAMPAAPHIFDDSGDSDDSSSAEEDPTDAEDTEISQTDPLENGNDQPNIEEGTPPQVEVAVPIPIETRGEWSRYFSSTDDRDYYFNSTTQVNQWDVPHEWSSNTCEENKEDEAVEAGRDSRCSSVTEELTSEYEESAALGELQQEEDD